MKIFVTTLLAALLVNNTYAADLDDFFKESDAFFAKYVNDGMVAYKAIKQNSSEIQSLYKQIGEMNLSGASDTEKKAFYINAYNLIVIYQVSKYYPLKSPLDQSGFFDNVKHKVAGQSLTLNHLEIQKLIFTYKDPRIHFALACAAKSCPPLASFAFTPDNIEKKLTERTKKSINDDAWLMVKPGQNLVEISKIFDWYKKDFTNNGKITVIDFINQYRSSKVPGGYKVVHYEYNWNLNEG